MFPILLHLQAGALPFNFANPSTIVKDMILADKMTGTCRKCFVNFSNNCNSELCKLRTKRVHSRRRALFKSNYIQMVFLGKVSPHVLYTEEQTRLFAAKQKHYNEIIYIIKYSVTLQICQFRARNMSGNQSKWKWGIYTL